MASHLSALTAAALLAALAFAQPASGAERSFTITTFEKIRVEGPFRVTLRTGVAPFARASGSAAALDLISLDVTGKTLVIRRKIARNGAASSGPVDIALGTHELTDAWLGGSGGLAISGVRGQAFDLGVNGSGAAEVGELDVDKLRVSVSGSAAVALGGKAQLATLIASGPSSIRAGSLSAKAATVSASGSAGVRLTATDTAKVSARGLAVIELDGSPACTVSPQTSGEVRGCK